MKKIVLISTALSFVFIFTQCKKNPLKVNPKVTHLTDYESNDGKISLRISGGKKPYKVSWSDGNADSVRIQLRAGTYYVNISDAKKNIVVDTIKVKQPPYPVCKDTEGNLYRTAIFGNQIWMTENLRTTKNDKGIQINSIKTSQEISQYGLLYDWQSAMNGETQENAQGICPDGWHIPTNAEWKELTDYFKTNDLEIKEAFNVQYAGFYNNGLNNIGESASYWSSSKAKDNVWKRYFHKNLSKIFSYHENKNNGISVRCVKNTK